MQLTAEQLRRMLQPPEAVTPANSQGEQRRTARTAAEVEATILPFSDVFALRAMQVPVRDVSRGGFGFLHDRPVPLGESFGLVLPSGGGPPVVVLCNVVFWEPLSADLYAVGARFSKILSSSGTDLPLMLEESVEVRQAS